MARPSLLRYLEPGDTGEYSCNIPLMIPTYNVGAVQASIAMASTTKLVLAAWHAAAANRNLFLRRVKLTILSNSAAGNLDAELVRISTAPTGGGAVTPFAFNKANAPESNGLTGMSLATGGGTVDGVLDSQSYNLAISAANANDSGLAQLILGDYWPSELTEIPIARAGFLEGFGLRLRHSANSTVVFTAAMEIGEA